MDAAARLLSAMSLGLAGCAQIHLVPDPPAIPPAFSNSSGNDFNGGRVQSIAISPADQRRSLVAMEFGGIWGTINGGNNWFRVNSLPAVMVGDVEFGSEGQTVVATVFRDNQAANGGGIYVSRDRGGTWTRPATGVVPPTASISRTSAYGIARAPDVFGLWYVGTDAGVAISSDDGASWTHKPLDPAIPQMAQAVLAFPRGQVLALTQNALYRSDDRGQTWRKLLTDGKFLQDFGYGVNKMDRSPDFPWAFIFREYHWGATADDRFGTLYLYEMDTGVTTLLRTPQGNARGPFVKVTREEGPEIGPWPITVWLGHGWDGFRVTRTRIEEFRALTQADWPSYIATAGIHSDMSDLGVNSAFKPVFLGSDGGIFKLRPPGVPGAGDWVSAAVPGSGMNSLQITDLAGTNIRRADGALLSSSLYFGTQDNYLWSSPDGGNSWPNRDCAEGFDLEVRPDARPGEPITVGYVDIGCDWSEQMADHNFANQRRVPNFDQNGQPLETFTNAEGQLRDTMKQAFYLAPSPGGTATSWVRLRTGVAPENGVYISRNNGENWKRRFTLNLPWAGSIQRTYAAGPVISGLVGGRENVEVEGRGRDGPMAWVSVVAGTGQIGLVPLSNLYADRVDTVDDSDVVRLPNGGSLGKRAAQWDWHAVFGVDPRNWQHLIAPDIIAGDVKVSRDGGSSWAVDARLTAQVLQGGRLLMYDQSGYRMQVTKIAFDPYRPGRILVGTRDAGVICTIDNGKTWRTITNSPRINYVTGFHFYPNGAAHIASWGHGLWYLKRNSGCSKTDPPYWQNRFPPIEVADANEVLGRGSPLPPEPRGITDPRIAKLFVTTAYPASGVANLGPDHRLSVSGRNFPRDGAVTIMISGAELHSAYASKHSVKVAADGTFIETLQLPKDLPYGAYSIAVVGGQSATNLAAGEFFKSPAADEGEDRESKDK